MKIEIESKFDLGDKVWTVYNDDVFYGIVDRICSKTQKVGKNKVTVVEYGVRDLIKKDWRVYALAGKVFDTREELAQSIAGDKCWLSDNE